MRSYFAVVLSSLLVVSSAFASDYCAPVRLDGASGSMSAIRPQVQGNLNICAFNSMAVMVDAMLAENAIEGTPVHITSPLALAVQRFSQPIALKTNRPQGKFFFEHSTSYCADFAALMDAGLGSCNESAMATGIVKHFPEPSWWEWLSNLNLYVSLDQIRRYADTLGNQETSILVGDQPLYQGFFLEKVINKLGGDQSLIEVVNQACRGKNFRALQFQCHSELETQGVSFVENQDAAVNKLHNLLDSTNGQPLAVSFCNEALTEREKNQLKFQAATGELSSCSTHSVVAIGRRRATNGSCQILLRNSQGVSCSDYAFPENCESGYAYWIDEDHLRGNIVNLAYLYKK